MMTVNEYHSYISPFGNEYILDTRGTSWIIGAVEGMGMPPITYITQRAPFQHGESLIGFHLMPRVIQMIIRRQFCTREQYWTGRTTLLDELRPNRQVLNGLPTGVPKIPTGTSYTSRRVVGALRTHLPDGSKRDVDVMIQDGPSFGPHGGWDERAFQEVLRFIAHNPVFYNPERRTTVLGLAGGGSQLVFSATFPIIFGVGAGQFDGLITYPGTWPEYPTIELSGPMNTPLVSNTSTSEDILLDYNIPAGDTVTISLLYGSKTVIDNHGTNLLGNIDSDSDLATFHLESAPGLVNGENLIQVTANNTLPGVSYAVVKWYERYIGI